MFYHGIFHENLVIKRWKQSFFSGVHIYFLLY